MAHVDRFHAEWRAYFVPLIFKKVSFNAFDEVPRFHYVEETTSVVAPLDDRVGRVFLPALLLGWSARLRKFPIVS